MNYVRKRVKLQTEINQCLKWVDAGLRKLLSEGKSPYIQIGLADEEEGITSEQNSKFHAMIGDIVKQAVFKVPGRTVKMSDYPPEEAKALLVRWFERECVHMGEPLRHGSRVVVDPFTGEQITIRASTTKFLKVETMSFIEWLYFTGNDGSVKWSEPALKEYQNYKEAQK